MTTVRVQTEAEFQAAIIALAETCGWKVAHFADSRKMVSNAHGDTFLVGDKQAAGFPDLVLCRGDQLVFAELKSEKGKLRPEQETWLEALANVEDAIEDVAGSFVHVHLWRPEDWPYIEALLTARGAA